MDKRVPVGESTRNTEERARSWTEIHAEGCFECEIPEKYCMGLETKEECKAYYLQRLKYEEAAKQRRLERTDKDRERYARRKALKNETA